MTPVLLCLFLGAFDCGRLAAAMTGPSGQAPVRARLADGAHAGTEGWLVHPGDADAEARLLYYAAVHGVEPGSGTAQAAGAPPVEVRVIGPLDMPLAGRHLAEPLPDHWCAIWCEALSEIIGYFGIQPPEQVRARLNMIWSRADTRLRARADSRRTGSKFDQSNLRMVSVERNYARYFVVDDYVYSHDRFDGGDSGPLERAVFVGADAVTVLPYDPVRDRVLLVEQIRASPIGRGDPSPWLMEPVAGRIEPGDTPEQTAHKETLEEAGITLSKLHPIPGYYPTTGAFSEYLYSYIGIADLPDGCAGLFGVDAEAEDIKGHLFAREDMMAMIAEGQIPVGTLQISAYWLALNLDRLRQSG